MKFYTLFFSIFIALRGFSQFFSISDIVENDRYDTESIFPVLSSKSNPKAAERINTYLHFAELTKVFGKPDSSIFSNVFPPEEEFWGQTGFSYSVYRNDAVYFSIGISYDNTGSYTENVTDYFTFISKTGEHVLLEDFFASTPLITIGEIVNGRCAERIEKHIKTIDPTQEDADEIIEMYQGCLESMQGSDYIYSGNFFLEEDNMVFIKERCSNRMMAALDELWEFQELMSYEILANFYSQNALNAYESGIWNSSEAVTLNDKILTGTINNSYPITARLRIDLEEGQISGVYWYDKVKSELHVSGLIKENGSYELTEYNQADEITGFFYGDVEGGTFSGKWENKDHSKSLPFILSLE
jgi:hypothetical protein